MPIGAAHQPVVNTRRRSGVPGMPAHVGDGTGVKPLINKDPQAAQVWTLVIDTASNSEVYGVNMTAPITGSANYTSDASATLDEIADGLADAWNDDPALRGYAEAVSDGVDTIVFTGVYPGVVVTIAEDENAAKTTLTETTTAAVADSVAFGRAMISLGYETDEGEELGILAKSSALTAQVDSYALTYDAGIEISAVIEVDGQTYESVPFAMATNIATVAAALDAAIDAAVPANTVIATNDTVDTVTITSELAGRPFKSWIRFGVGASTAAAVKTSTEGDLETDINECLAGIAQWSSDVAVEQLPSATSDEAVAYPANDMATVRYQGKIWVEVDSGATITRGGDVYIELDGTGSDAGRLYSSGGSTRALLNPDLVKWERGDFSGSDADIALVSLHLKH